MVYLTPKTGTFSVLLLLDSRKEMKRILMSYLYGSRLK